MSEETLMMGYEQYADERLEIVKHISSDRLREIAEAEREGRLIMLPCSVGDTLYLIVHGFVEETKARTFFVGHPSYNRGDPSPEFEMIRCTNFDLPLKDFGVTIFRARAEAESALAEKKKS